MLLLATSCASYRAKYEVALETENPVQVEVDAEALFNLEVLSIPIPHTYVLHYFQVFIVSALVEVLFLQFITGSMILITTALLPLA